jgi:hypothetical protein
MKDLTQTVYIYNMGGVYSTDTRELFVMHVLYSEGVINKDGELV